MSLERLIKLVRPNEPVVAGTPNRPIGQLHQNIEYLWEVISAAALGSTVYAREVTIESAVQVGMPVYFHTASQEFKRALANVSNDLETGLLTTAASSQVWGICAIKHNATLADLLLFGYDDIDISAAVDGDVDPGTYYLSAASPGMLTTARPPVTVPVLRARDGGYVFVNPQFIDFLDTHRHYRFELTCAPAGAHSPPDPGNRHSIEAPNGAWPGWLPADHASFEGLAPSNAVFGYNLAAHAALRNIWPPVPVQNVYLEWDKAVDPEEGYNGVPLGPGGLAVIDRNGIWWLSDCWGDVPWPRNLTTDASTESASEEVNDDFPPECPRDPSMSLVLWFTKLQFATDSMVTSLVSLDDRLKIYCAGSTDVASTGDLEIDLELNLTMGDDNKVGYLAMKELEEATGKIHRGPVTSGLYAGSSNVTLLGQATTTWQNKTVHHGHTKISVTESTSRELRPQLIRLMGATEEHFPALYLGLPNDNLSRFVARFVVPTDVDAGSLFAYRATVLGRSAGTLPPLTVEYNIVNRPTDGLDTPVDVDESYTALTFDPTGAVAANQAVEATSSTFAITPGDEVFIRVTRDPSDDLDGYSGECGIMQQTGVLSAAS